MSDTSIVAIALFGLLAFFITFFFIIGGAIAFIAIVVVRPTLCVSVQPITTVPLKETSHNKCDALNAAFDAITIAEKAKKEAEIALRLASSCDDALKKMIYFINQFALMYTMKLSEANQIPENTVDQNQQNAPVAVNQPNAPVAVNQPNAPVAVNEPNPPVAVDEPNPPVAVNAVDQANAADAAFVDQPIANA